MFSKSLKMIKIDRNKAELWKVLCRNIIVTWELLLVLLCELLINARTWITLRMWYILIPQYTVVVFSAASHPEETRNGSFCCVASCSTLVWQLLWCIILQYLIMTASVVYHPAVSYSGSFCGVPSCSTLFWQLLWCRILQYPILAASVV
jgi:hypothetical protein